MLSRVMRQRRDFVAIRAAGAGRMGGGGAAMPFPYSVDFTALPDGPLPSWFKGGNWVVSGGKAVGTPTMVERLINGAFTTWVAGVPTGWSKGGTGTITENPAGNVQMAGAVLVGQTVPAAANKGFYHAELECTAAAAGDVIYNPDYAGVEIVLAAPGIGFHDSYKSSNFYFVLGTATGEDVTVDNAKCQQITDAMTLLLAPSADMSVSAVGRAAVSGHNWIGVIARANTQINPTDYLLGVCNTSGNVYGVYLYQCRGGVIIPLGSNSSVAAISKPRLVCSGTSIKLYDDIYLRVDVVVDEPTINNNLYCGIWSSSGGNSLDSFFSHSSGLVKSLYQGGSNTQGDIATTQWPPQNYRNIVNYYKDSDYVNIAYGGTTSWYGLVTLQTIIDAAPDVVYLEYCVNDASDLDAGTRTNKFAPCAEAMIRKLRTALPNARIIVVNLYQDNSLQNTVAPDKWNALAAKYACDLYEARMYLRTVIGSDDPTDLQLAPYCDGVHWTALGHTQIAVGLFPHLAGWYLNPAPGWSGNLADYDPPYFEDEADWENDPIIRTGIDNDGETGTGWSTAGTTSRQSTTANDTISWTGTFCSFGLEHGLAGSPIIKWSVDGGAETQLSLAAPGYTQISNFERGEHTVTIKVVSGTVLIKKFFAI